MSREPEFKRIDREVLTRALRQAARYGVDSESGGKRVNLLLKRVHLGERRIMMENTLNRSFSEKSGD
jgi:hypothetical protein